MEQVIKTLRRANRDHGVHCIVTAPKVGLTTCVKRSIDQISGKEKDGSTRGMDWNHALQKYHGKSEHRDDESIVPLKVKYLDLRGIFQRPLLLSCIARIFGLAFPESYESLEDAVKQELGRPSSSIDVLILDHISIAASRELFEVFSSASLSFGVVLICPLVASVSSLLQSGQRSIEDLTHMTPNVIQRHSELIAEACQVLTTVMGESRVTLVSSILSEEELQSIAASLPSTTPPTLAQRLACLPAVASLVSQFSDRYSSLLASTFNRTRENRCSTESALSQIAEFSLTVLSVYSTLWRSWIESYPSLTTNLLDVCSVYHFIYGEQASNNAEACLVYHRVDPNSHMEASEIEDGMKLGLLSPLTMESEEECGVVISSSIASLMYYLSAQQSGLSGCFFRYCERVVRLHALQEVVSRVSFSHQIASAARRQNLWLSLWHHQLMYDWLFRQIARPTSDEAEFMESLVMSSLLLVAHSKGFYSFFSIYKRIQFFQLASKVSSWKLFLM